MVRTQLDMLNVTTSYLLRSPFKPHYTLFFRHENSILTTGWRRHQWDFDSVGTIKLLARLFYSRKSISSAARRIWAWLSNIVVIYSCVGQIVHPYYSLKILNLTNLVKVKQKSSIHTCTVALSWRVGPDSLRYELGFNLSDGIWFYQVLISTWKANFENYSDVHAAKRFHNWAQSQVDYVLGAKSNGYSYMVGYGKKYPRRPHHRAASCPKDMSKVCDYSFALEKDDNPTVWGFD